MEYTYHDITLFDFENLCREKQIRHHTYLTTEQNHDTVTHTITFRFTGKLAPIQYHPNRIVLVGDDGELRFERVKYIRVYHINPEEGLYYGIICEYLLRRSGEIEYRIAASQK